MEDKDKQQMDYLDKVMKENQKDDGGNDGGGSSNNVVIDGSENLKYIQIEISSLPLSYFYKEGTKISIRAAEVSEIQAYSVVNDENYLDVTEKMNQLLSSCTRVILPGNVKGSYKDIKDGDRLFLIFLIRELTFQKGHSYSKPVKCGKCKHSFDIPFRASSNKDFPKTFEFYEMPESIEEYYDKREKLFKLDFDKAIYKLAPPTIGIQEQFFGLMKEKVAAEQELNVSFNKVMPFLLPHVSHVSEKGLVTREQEYTGLDIEVWGDIDAMVDEMKFGLKGLKMNCPECGSEVHTDVKFPTGAKGIFHVSSRFEKHNK